MSSPRPLTLSREASRLRDEGSATVEFLLVSILVVTVALAVMQLAFALHVRNILISSAHEGAHYAANADRSLADGEERAKELVQDSLGTVGAEFDASQTEVEGMPAIEVQISARVPLIGLWGAGTQTVVAHALAEGPVG